jgi:unsaturated chondroitin disaccharide hydrolase
MIESDSALAPDDLLPSIERMWKISGEKILRLQQRWDSSSGTPVFTVAGSYTTRGWTEWTQGFQFGSAILQFDATDDAAFLDLARAATVNQMAPHVSHTGVHDHGFNNVSTYGNLLRLMNEGRIPEDRWEREFYTLALKLSGAVQSARWTQLNDDEGFIHSFNGPQSLFADTIRSLRALALSWRLGHQFMGEGDRKISLLDRLKKHAAATTKYNVFFGENRDAYDVRGRVAHESIFNVTDGTFRCSSTQQGYSPFSTWTRGLAWVLLGSAELLELFRTLDARHDELTAMLESTARATADFFIENTPTDGIPYWDTGAPGLGRLGNYLEAPAQIENDWEPVDSSAAAIAAQGLIRLGEIEPRYRQAGLAVARTLLGEPYLSTAPEHEGLLLHSIYHRPRGWDYVPPGSLIPKGESSMWGDYHLRELALQIQRQAEGAIPLTFFSGLKEPGL